MNQKLEISANEGSADLKAMAAASHTFFNDFGSRHLLGDSFFRQVGSKSPKVLFEDLLSACRYKNGSKAFFIELLDRIFSRSERPVSINGIQMPMIFLTRLLEIVRPGNRLHRITHTGQIESLGFIVPQSEKGRLQQVIELYPVKLSDHVVRQSLLSESVAGQYLPFAEELDRHGDDITFDGHLKQGVLEQMYENRVIFLLDMQCPVYCRFCFRKHKGFRKKKAPDRSEILSAVDHVGQRPAIKEILITGGEPLLNRSGLDTALTAIKKVSHVRVIRIATRSAAYYPELFLKNNKALIKYLVNENRQLVDAGKRLEIGIHFVHPDEMSIQSLEIITTLVKMGIQVYVQTPFLNHINTDGKDLATLFTRLRNAGAQIYYIFAPCSPIRGTQPFWAPISKALKAMDYLRRHLSDRCIPKLCTATPLGKIEWGTSGWAVQKDAADPAFTWIRTPYTMKYYRLFVENESDIPRFRENNEGTLDARFRVDMGNDALLSGGLLVKRKPHIIEKAGRLPDKKTVSNALLKTAALRPSILPVPAEGISRVHTACLETYVHAIDNAVAYLKKHSAITDLIVHPDEDALADPGAVITMIKKVKQIESVTCLRLCCRIFNRHPEFVDALIAEGLCKTLNDELAHPFRLEIETWFLTPDQITDHHKKAAWDLIFGGICVYANVPMISRINDDPKTMVALADSLRRAGVEFHHLYVGGLPIQYRFNQGSGIAAQRLIDIASAVRRACSGRQIPLYVIQTPNGEIPADVTPSFVLQNQ